MHEPRPEKAAVVDEVRERIGATGTVLITEYRGLSVSALQELRGGLRPIGGSYRIYKNTLVRRAADADGLAITEHLTGPTALAFPETAPDGTPPDVVGVAKVLRDFAKNNPELIIKGGLLDGAPLDAGGVRALADLESREVLLAKFAGLLAAPMQQLAGLMQALPRNLAYGLAALIDAGGGSPAADDAAGDAADDPAAPAPADAVPVDPADDPTAPAPADAVPVDPAEDTPSDTNPDQEED
ncbi:MAG: 50S ribosomal protein L10 [Acidimicrobiales bacterium]